MYLIIYLYLFIYSILIKNKSENYKDKIFRYSIVTLCIIGGFRFEVGHDYQSYYSIHSSSTWHLSDGDFIEPGYTILSKLCSILISDNEMSFQLLVLIFCSITMYLYYKVINRYSDNKMLSLAILFPMYFLNTVFGQIRYGLVLALCIYSYKYIENKQFKKFLVTILIAFSFHFSAIFFLPVYFLAHLELSSITKLFVFIFSIIFGVLINPVNIVQFINDKTIKSSYITSKISLYSSSSISIFSLTFIYILVIFLFMYSVYKLSSQKNRSFEIMLNIIYWGIIFYIFTNRFEIIAFRASSYFFILEIIMLPNIFKFIRVERMYIKKILFYFITIYSAYRLYITVFYWVPVFVPYRNYIFHLISEIFYK